MNRMHRLMMGSVLAVLVMAAANGASVRDFGAIGDGQADDTAAFQAALDAAAAGGVVSAEAGVFRIEGNLRIPAGVTLEGAFRSSPTCYYNKGPEMIGTVLHAVAGRGTPEAAPFIQLAGNGAGLAGWIIHYPEWRQADVPPVPYPPTVFAQEVTDTFVRDCCIVNPYEALHFQNAHRMQIRNVCGYPSFRALYIDACFDIGRIENCHFWPFGISYKHDDPYCKWVNTNGVAYEFARTDWQYVTHTFCFGYGIGYRFSKTKNGMCNGSFVGIGADSCRRAVYVEDCQEAGLLITNGEFVGRWGSTDSVGLEIGAGATGGKVSLVNCAFWGPLDRCIWQHSPDIQLTCSACNFCNWDNAFIGSPAIEIDAGKAILQGNTFRDGHTHVRLGDAVRSALITANQASGGFHCDARGARGVQLMANEASLVIWPDHAKKHYQVDIGATGDSPYIRHWYGKEPAGEWGGAPGSKRWSMAVSQVLLPVEASLDYTIAFDVHVPALAIGAGAGIYYGDKRLAELPKEAGPALITVPIPQAPTEDLRLEIRCQDWSPREHLEGSEDDRQLGIAVRRLTVRAEGAPDPCYNANTGDWIE